MLDAINNFVANAMDYVLGWVLYLPRDLGLFVVALLTSGLRLSNGSRPTTKPSLPLFSFQVPAAAPSTSRVGRRTPPPG